jgi:hypothetical protein
LDGLLDIIDVAQLGDALDVGPGILSTEILQGGAINLARVLALADGVAYRSWGQQPQYHTNNPTGGHTSLATVLANAVGALLNQVLRGFALLALHRRSIRAVSGHMALLAAVVAGASKGTLDTLVRAVSLVVTIPSCQSALLRRPRKRENYPGWPQL